MDKKVKMKLFGLDGNAFSILGRFRAAAKKAKWTEEEINAVCEDAISSNYAHLINTIAKHTK